MPLGVGGVQLEEQAGVADDSHQEDHEVQEQAGHKLWLVTVQGGGGGGW